MISTQNGKPQKNFKNEPCSRSRGECDHCAYGTNKIGVTNWCCKKTENCSFIADGWLPTKMSPLILKTNALKTELCLKSPNMKTRRSNSNNDPLQEYHFYPTDSSSLIDLTGLQVKESFCANQGELCDCVGSIRYVTKNSSTINDNTFATNTNNTFFLTQTLEPVLCDHSIGKYGSCICQPLPKEWNQQVAQVNIQFTESGALYFRHGIEPTDVSNTMKYDLLSTMSSNIINLTRTDLGRQLELLNTQHPMLTISQLELKAPYLSEMTFFASDEVLLRFRPLFFAVVSATLLRANKVSATLTFTKMPCTTAMEQSWCLPKGGINGISTCKNSVNTFSGSKQQLDSAVYDSMEVFLRKTFLNGASFHLRSFFFVY